MKMKWEFCFFLAGIYFLFHHTSAASVLTIPEDSVDHFLYDVNSGPGQPHIVGGTEVKPHSHPYQVALILSSDIDQGFCGASLVSDQWVLTAAHCTHFPSSKYFSLVVGAHRIREDENTTQTIPIDKVNLHPQWGQEYLENDISLLRLTFPAKLNEYVQPIRLPSASQKNWSFWNWQATTTGWGYDSDNNKKVSSVLRSVDTRVVTNFFCWIMYQFSHVKDTNICISGWFGKGHCNGDSGGPVSVVESDGIRTLIGISSFGVNMGCEKSWPSVNTRLTSYFDWIHNTSSIPIRQ